MVLLFEGYKEPEVLEMLQSDNPDLPSQIIQKAWAEKWSKVYCPLDSTGAYGYVNLLLLESQCF